MTCKISKQEYSFSKDYPSIIKDNIVPQEITFEKTENLKANDADGFAIDSVPIEIYKLSREKRDARLCFKSTHELFYPVTP